MIIIWGSRALRTLHGTGAFHCPRCGMDSQFQHVRYKRWFTFFFIPIIPLEVIGTCVECTRCKGQFTEAVLSAPTLGVLELHLGLAFRAGVAHIASLAQPLDAAVEAAAARALSSAAGVSPDYGRDALHVDVRAFADPVVAVRYVGAVAEPMTVAGKEDLLHRLVRLAETLPRRVPETERAVEAFAYALDISRAHLAGIRAAAATDAAPRGEL